MVFVGGALGTAARYGVSSSMNTLPHPLSIRWGTFTANVIAAFALAAITAALSHTLLSEHAPASQKRAGELISKGLGMGVCGGLSTMSTLALEIAASDYGWSAPSLGRCSVRGQAEPSARNAEHNSTSNSKRRAVLA